MPLLILASFLFAACEASRSKSWVLELSVKEQDGARVEASIKKSKNSDTVIFQYAISNTSDRLLCVPTPYDGAQAFDKGVITISGQPKRVDYHYHPFPGDAWDSYILIPPEFQKIVRLSENKSEILRAVHSVDFDVLVFFCDSFLSNRYPTLGEIVGGRLPDESSGFRFRYENVDFPTTG